MLPLTLSRCEYAISPKEEGVIHQDNIQWFVKNFGFTEAVRYGKKIKSVYVWAVHT